jgi:hypothetical protein
MKPANVSGIIALSLLAGSAVALAQDPCDQLLHKAKDRGVEPTSREIAAQQAALCFQMPKGAVEKLHGESNEQGEALADKQAAVAEARNAEADAKSAIDFEGKLGFGVGIGFSWGRGAERVEDAEVVSGVVRVKRAATDKPRLFLEAHKFVWVHRAQGIGVGPFVSVQSGADDALSSWGAGIMVGFREKAKQGDEPTSWNLGLGYLWDADVKTLGDGVVADAPLPEGETEIRYKNTSAGSVFVVFSRRF